MLTNNNDRDFPGSPVAKNSPANAGDIAGFDPWSRKIPCALGQASPYATTTEPKHPRAHALQQEKSPPREACTLQLESRPHSPQ